MNSDTTINAFEWIMNHPVGSDTSVRVVESYLLTKWFLSDSENPMAITVPFLKEATGYSLASVRRAITALAQSGRWEIVRGTGIHTTTYVPTFINSIIGGAK